MAEQTNDQTAAPEQKIMCFVSKKMVPLASTIEVEYGHGKKVRVLPKYVKFDLDQAR